MSTIHRVDSAARLAELQPLFKAGDIVRTPASDYRVRRVDGDVTDYALMPRVSTRTTLSIAATAKLEVAIETLDRLIPTSGADRILTMQRVVEMLREIEQEVTTTAPAGTEAAAGIDFPMD